MKMDSLQYVKRVVKATNNLMKDPLPRNKSISISALLLQGADVRIAFRAMDEEFTYVVSFPNTLAEKLGSLSRDVFNYLFTAVAITFVPSFFKMSDFESVKIETSPLDSDTIEFFEIFLLKGLAEFRFLQGLNPSRRVRVIAESGNAPVELPTARVSDKLIMLNGGGKDTIVAAELLLACQQPFTWVSVNPDDTKRKVIEVSGNLDALELSFKADLRMHRLSRYQWGHVPFAGICAALGAVVAILTGSRYVASGNEASANFGNVLFRGEPVNHQYSKSFEFEKGFAEFIKRCICSDLEVFSILRPFHDVQLAMLFSNMTKYHSHFISCNRKIKQGVWCKECPKCAFTALALYPFVKKEGIVTIFGEDILRTPVIQAHILKLVSGGIKPWECVGTLEESRLALSLVLQAYPDFPFVNSKISSGVKKALSVFDVEEVERRILYGINDEHIIPELLVGKIDSALGESIALR
ncbi:hypothetical protein [Kineobactrum salinum]|uniref:UDP-N-acetyl-alpha-D-muramoyl-L-alanyl-L-glutamate epimerase n=1 Tax=Kineobactrum salinum TaxID=2708301 RepID=A0A6C0TYV2_9GAMM|nr:hypothetical protein [Kineobactrum salinum]QIB64713.1 hypothetical protein G3T16_04215 [Kineobactrum salinum]